MSFSSILKNNFITHVQEKGLEVIKEDRDKYSFAWDAIETYCKKNKLIISNVYNLIGKEGDFTNVYKKTYNLYTDNPFLHSNNLANFIHEHTTQYSESRFIKLKTMREQEEFLIEYDLRMVCTVYKIQKFKSSKFKKTDKNKLLKP